MLMVKQGMDNEHPRTDPARCDEFFFERTAVIEDGRSFVAVATCGTKWVEGVGGGKRPFQFFSLSWRA